MKISLKQISELTGHTRATVTNRLRDFPSEDGPKGARLYESTRVLKLSIEGAGQQSESGDFIDKAEAERRLTIAREQQVRLEMEVTSKERIPLDVVTEINEQAALNVSGLLKAHEGKTLNAELINDLFANLRECGTKIAEWAKS